MTIGDVTSQHEESLAKTVVDAIFKVHKALGPGLLESAYEACLHHELTRRGLTIRRQLNVPIEYEGITLESGFRLDFLVEDAIVVEIKAVEKMIPLYSQQLLTYLRLMKRRLGFLVNFNSILIKDGIQRVIN